MELNNNVLQQISEVTGIGNEELLNALKDENATIEVPKLYKENDIETLTQNVQKEAYEKGKQTGVEMQLKALKQSYREKGIETDGIKDFETLIDSINKKSLTDVSNMTKKERETYEAEKAELQKLIQEKESAINEVTKEHQNFIRKTKTDSLLKSEFDKINFDIPKHVAIKGEAAIGEFLQKERQKAEILFKSSYSIDFDENGNSFVKKGDEVLKDDLKNYKQINALLPDFLNEYNINTISEKPVGRGQSFSNKSSTANFTGMSKSDFDNYIFDKGIKRGISDEYTALYKKWKQDNE